MSAPQNAFDPSTRAYRFTVLFFASMLMFGSYFAYDSIGAISTELIKELSLDRSTIGDLYAMYSWAAIGVVLIGGVLIDRLGMRRASLAFNTLIVIGSVIVAFSRRVWMLYVGRLVFGAGSEALITAQNAILARWFTGKELALAFGIALTVSRVGTMFSFNTEALIASHFGGFRAALWAAVFFCLISWLCNLVFNALDKRGEVALSLPTPEAGDTVSWADIRKFSASYWYVTLLCVTFYSGVFPFTSLAKDFFNTTWGIPAVAEGGGSFLTQVFGSFLHLFSTAGGITSIPIFASMMLAPFAGHLVDKIGRRASLMIVGSLLFIPAHLLMGLTTIYPAYPMALLGVAFVLVPAAMWPAIPLIVPAGRVGTAYGVTTMIQNIGLGGFSKLNGLLRDYTKTYRASQLMFAGLGVVGLIFAILLRFSDSRQGGVLEAAKGDLDGRGASREPGIDER